MNDIGHNSDAPAGFAKDQLKTLIERVERMDEEIKALNADKRDIFAEAKANGFCSKALKMVIRRRAQDSNARDEIDALVALYESSLNEKS